MSVRPAVKYRIWTDSKKTQMRGVLVWGNGAMATTGALICAFLICSSRTCTGDLAANPPQQPPAPGASEEPSLVEPNEVEIDFPCLP